MNLELRLSCEKILNPWIINRFKTCFAGAVDTVGGVILENIIKSTNTMGVIASCGNVASPKLDLTVFPFILRGISLIGIDSQNYPMPYREQVWNKLSKDWKPDNLSDIATEITLNELSEKNMLNGVKANCKIWNYNIRQTYYFIKKNL
jgi:NADPH:quinone reductase-like Zn-dependent oxidoreductase